MKFVQTPALVVMLEEGNVHSYRQFFLDGRNHPKDIEPLWMGDSVAKWDGDTLVVDTVGLNDKTWPKRMEFAARRSVHVIERYQPRPDLGHLSVDATLDDPRPSPSPHSIAHTHY